MLAVAWAKFQPRTVGLATALGGKPAFISSSLGQALPPLRYAAAAVKTWQLLEQKSPEQVLVVTPPVFAPLICWLWAARRRRPLVVDCHTGTLGSAKWGWADPLHRWLMRRASATLLHTEQALSVAEGWGAHLDTELALVQALTEATQSRAVSIAGARDDLQTISCEWRNAPPAKRQA